MVLTEENMTDGTLLSAVDELWNDRQQYIDAMSASPLHNGVGVIIDLIENTV